MFDWIQNYIDKLWRGIQERLTHFDADGTTAWSEAPAEGIFSILQNCNTVEKSYKTLHNNKRRPQNQGQNMLKILQHFL